MKTFNVGDFVMVRLRPDVTPQSRGYGDVTATFIRRVKIPSHMYGKYSYRQESEYESTVVIYIPIK